jgi:ribonuclease P protein component
VRSSAPVAPRAAPSSPLNPEVLARAHRIVSGDDYRAVVRKARRVTTVHAVIYTMRSSTDRPSRFGFIVSKAVGNAVVRNLVRRRLKAIAAELISAVPTGTEIVVRALPVAAQAGWVTLRAEISSVVRTSPVVNKGMAPV